MITSTIKQITDAIAEESGKLAGSINTLENRLSSVKSDVDAIRGTQDLISQKVLPIKDIETHIQHQLISQASLDEKMKLMQSSLAKLQDEVSCFSSRNHQPLNSTAVQDNLPTASHHTPLLHKHEFMTDMKENFLDEDSARSIQEFLDNASFKEENGHSVLAYGVPYKYTGARSPTDVPAVPEQLRSLMDQVNRLQEDTFFSQYPDCKKYERPAPPINSILINKYQGQDSFLPRHSDDEDTIHRESHIFTLSLGAECHMDFHKKDEVTENPSSGPSSVLCTHRSLYTMSRKSQEFFQHEIGSGRTESGTRYSLTFRSISRWNSNSTCIIGDSNTGGLNFGMDKRKTKN